MSDSKTMLKYSAEEKCYTEIIVMDVTYFEEEQLEQFYQYTGMSGREKRDFENKLGVIEHYNEVYISLEDLRKEGYSFCTHEEGIWAYLLTVYYSDRSQDEKVMIFKSYQLPMTRTVISDLEEKLKRFRKER